jgi:hopanoid-associated phosphorylase
VSAAAPPDEPHVIVVCGLAFEARAAAGEGVVVICSGEQRQLAAMLRETLTPATLGLVSFGCAAGLAPEMRTGTCVIARTVLAIGEAFVTDPQWSARMLAALPKAVHADLASVERPIQLPAEKRGLHARTGAVAVDMESHIAGRLARERGLPFAALRVVLDPAGRAVPKAALAGHGSDGSSDVRAVMRALWRRPRELPEVIRLGFDFAIASRALLRCRRQLGERFAVVDVGHHPLDVA